jgi:hypothetical protein
MKTLKSAFLIIVIITGVSCFNAKGQVTIGSDLEPLSGVLLDIKSTNGTTAGDATTTVGGLKLPRVSLNSETELTPFLSSSTSGEKKDRAGLMVYNVSSTAPFKPGVYVWDGAKWNVAGGGVKWFYMPSFNISVSSTGTSSINLYEKYKQFLKAGNQEWISSNSSLSGIPSPDSGGLYAANQLDYVITYYDPTVFNNIAINSSGLMTYNVLSTTTTSATYFNIIFVVK